MSLENMQFNVKKFYLTKMTKHIKQNKKKKREKERNKFI